MAEAVGRAEAPDNLVERLFTSLGPAAEHHTPLVHRHPMQHSIPEATDARGAQAAAGRHAGSADFLY